MDHTHYAGNHQHNFNHNHDDSVVNGQNAYYSGAAASILTQATSFTPPSHFHYTNTPTRFQDTDFRNPQTSGVIDNMENRPPFRAFLFIMRIK